MPQPARVAVPGDTVPPPLAPLRPRPAGSLSDLLALARTELAALHVIWGVTLSDALCAGHLQFAFGLPYAEVQHLVSPPAPASGSKEWYQIHRDRILATRRRTYQRKQAAEQVSAT